MVVGETVIAISNSVLTVTASVIAMIGMIGTETEKIELIGTIGAMNEAIELIGMIGAMTTEKIAGIGTMTNEAIELTVMIGTEKSE